MDRNMSRSISRKLSIVLVVALGSLAGGCAAVGAGVSGNDTGGIIPWSPENQLAARTMAGEHCAYYGRDFRITSMIRQPGHYIAFECR
jgi:hypothetical protein